VTESRCGGGEIAPNWSVSGTRLFSLPSRNEIRLRSGTRTRAKRSNLEGGFNLGGN